MANADYETHEHDVVVIGAGGAGLRAAIEAAAQGVSVGLICKSLLGTAHVGDRTGLEMIRTLQYHGIHQGIDVYMECTIARLLKDGERVSGAVGYWRPHGKVVLFKAKAVVLATGGIGKAWKITSNSWEYTGDGHALALWAGADLIDMEFV